MYQNVLDFFEIEMHTHLRLIITEPFLIKKHTSFVLNFKEFKESCYMLVILKLLPNQFWA